MLLRYLDTVAVVVFVVAGGGDGGGDDETVHEGMDGAVASMPFFAHVEAVAGADEGAERLEALVESHGAGDRLAGALGEAEAGGERYFAFFFFFFSLGMLG